MYISHKLPAHAATLFPQQQALLLFNKYTVAAGQHMLRSNVTSYSRRSPVSFWRHHDREDVTVVDLRTHKRRKRRYGASAGGAHLRTT